MRVCGIIYMSDLTWCWHAYVSLVSSMAVMTGLGHWGTLWRCNNVWTRTRLKSWFSLLSTVTQHAYKFSVHQRIHLHCQSWKTFEEGQAELVQDFDALGASLTIYTAISCYNNSFLCPSYDEHNFGAFMNLDLFPELNSTNNASNSTNTALTHCNWATSTACYIMLALFCVVVSYSSLTTPKSPKSKKKIVMGRARLFFCVYVSSSSLIAPKSQKSNKIYWQKDIHCISPLL